MTAAVLDVLVIGAGLAGSAAAVVLGRQGRRVALVDPRPEYPHAFKAEKIEPDQAALFRQVDLMDGVAPHAARIRQVTDGHRGRVLRTFETEQYGIFYQDMVNAVRRQMPASVDQHTARVTDVATDPEIQRVTLDTGATLAARLVVLAGGTVGGLHEKLGIMRREVRNPHSLCSGFDVARVDGTPFPFESLTYWPDSVDSRIDYVTFFPIPGRMRINMFTYRDARDPWVKELAAAPDAVLERDIPMMQRITGRWRATSKVETRPIDLYVAEPPGRDGIVLIGDACQSVCPATGTGVSKVMTDVTRLCLQYAPHWLTTQGMTAAKISEFYRDDAKSGCDADSLAAAEFRREFGTRRTLRWWLKRRRKYLRLALEGLRGT